MPTAKGVLVQLSRRHTWNLKGGYSIAPEWYVPGGGEQLPGWVVVCTATSRRIDTHGISRLLVQYY